MDRHLLLANVCFFYQFQTLASHYNGSLTVTGIKIDTKKQDTYNFEVADFHTYFVGKDQVWVHNACGPEEGGSVFKTTKEATETAKQLGYRKTRDTIHGQAVYTNGKRFISRDIDGHNGGVWKVGKSIRSLGSRATREGTFDKYLERKIGD